MALCKGYAIWATKDGEAVETLYAVMPDNSVLVSRDQKPNMYFSEGKQFNRAPEISAEWVRAAASFIGNYPEPQNVV